MGWGINFNTDIFLSRISISSSYELDQKVEEIEDSLAKTKSLVLMYASANPKDVTPDDWRGDGLSFVHERVEELLLEYEQDLKMLIDLNYYKETKPFN